MLSRISPARANQQIDVRQTGGIQFALKRRPVDFLRLHGACRHALSQFLRSADDFLLTAVIQRDIELQAGIFMRAANGGVQRFLLLFQPPGMPSMSPSMRMRTFFSFSSSISLVKYCSKSRISAPTSSVDRFQFSVENA